MFKDTQKVTVKDGSILPSKEEIIFSKTEKLMEEISRFTERQKTLYSGTKPMYEYYVIGFDSDFIAITDVIVLYNAWQNRYAENFNISNWHKPMIVFSSVNSDESRVKAVVRKTIETYGPRAKFIVLSSKL